MSALVLGKRSSCFFEDLHHHAAATAAASTPPSASKKARFGSSSFRFSPTSSAASPSTRDVVSSSFTGGSPTVLGHLRSLFPDMDEQLLERVLEASGNDLDSAIKSLTELRLGPAKEHPHSVMSNPNEYDGAAVQPSAEAALVVVRQRGGAPGGRCRWVEVLVREMMNAANVDDARARASAVLEVFEKSVAGRVTVNATGTLQKENAVLKEQLEGLLRDNEILKRAVAIQHERQKEFDEKTQELHHLKQLLAQYQEQLRTLEVNNYALSLHLKQAQQSSSIPGRFHPDVF
ncbi:unnamed protein product [Spirodela intermedia]|uniref:CUE domain-containing protein n=1 Tax=Spirodela intermedia TaxID=51605 RepID=A0A7I8JM03_SPIIN|nr:unnamed protein product [Spirodela intermedia]CAA6670492.1 unnamed protein product [Spirodela intermedia]